MREVGLRAVTAVQVRLPAPLEAGRRPLALRRGTAGGFFLSMNIHRFSYFPHGAGTRMWGSAAYVLKRDSADDITITQMFITLAIMLEVY